MNLNFITSEEYHKIATKAGLNPEPMRILIYRESLNGKCCNCDNHVWRLVDNDMCFSCTTGEADGSDDYEIGAPY